jgi:hypothetical protein
MAAAEETCDDRGTVRRPTPAEALRVAATDVDREQARGLCLGAPARHALGGNKRHRSRRGRRLLLGVVTWHVVGGGGGG